jgi:hypothetical protein
VQHHIELFNGLQGTYVGEFLFVSHRWEKQESPDPKCAQLHAVQAHLRQNPQIKYVWFDFWCMPQHWCVPYRAENGRTADEQSDFERMLPNIPLLCLGCSVLIVLDLAYNCRFWTQFEAWLSMQRASATGLAPDEALKRVTVACVHNGSAATEQQLYALWANKRVMEAQATLAADDVYVTNQKDKDER